MYSLISIYANSQTLDIITIIGLIMSAIGLIISVCSIILVVIVEMKRRPTLEVSSSKEYITGEDKKRNPPYMWHHLKVKNKESKFFNRDAALQCLATISFLDKDSGKLLKQIQAHWTNNPEPRIWGKFEYTLVSLYKRMNIGFREEPLDILIKFKGDKSFYAADPEVIYRFVSGEYGKDGKEHSKMKEWNIDVVECIIKVELDAINIGKRKISYFRLKSTGYNMDAIKLEELKNFVS